MGLTGWYETEALLRGDDGELARAEVERVAKTIGNNRRYRLPLLRSRAVLARWDGDTDWLNVLACLRSRQPKTITEEIGD